MQMILALYRRTLCNVWFGIALMLAIGVYISIGSGLPQVRAYFEMNDLAFFNAWPLRVLMVLLVVTLATITWERIPFTPPRYGVWMVHAGIIVLIYGMFLYYTFKVEGLAFVPLNQTAHRFYLNNERALYIRLNGSVMRPEDLPSLPRYHAYAPRLGNATALDRKDLKGIVPVIAMPDESGRRVPQSLEMFVGQPVTVDIVEYWPYAKVVSSVLPDPAEGHVGVKLSWQPPAEHAKEEPGQQWLVTGDSSQPGTMIGSHEVELRTATAEIKKQTQDALDHMHTLTVNVGQTKQVLHVVPGKSYDLGQTGYRLTIEEFQPDFPAMNGEIVPLLTMMVKTPTQEFRRQVIPGREKPTDWKLNEPGAGPLGKRQDQPLDGELKTDYAYSDPMNLSPVAGDARYVILAAADGGLTVLRSGRMGSPVVMEMPAGEGQIELSDGDGHKQTLQISKPEKVRIEHRIVEVPVEQRERDEMGVNQVLMVRVTMGSWSRELPVTYSEFALEQPGWQGAEVPLPGMNYQLQFTLGNAVWDLPALVTLEKFELVNYPGGTMENTNVFRDFQSHLRVEELDESRQKIVDRFQAVAKMNSPIYFGGVGGSTWTLFQAQWDRNQQFTVLGVGNRVGVWVMLAGSILMTVGLLWAFYLKPVLVARMKAQAILDAAVKKGVKKANLVGAK